MSSLVLPPFSGTTGAVGSAATPLKRKVEPYGRAYQQTKHAPPKPSSHEEDEQNEAAKVGVQIRDPKYDRYNKFDIDLHDYYTLLGLEDKMFDATKEEITEAYRTLCKVIHPDKAFPEDRVKAEERYKALQVGFETLTDAARRRGYDSSLEFDDAIPKDNQGTTEKTFFSVYGPVFESNARFSTIRPVPKLGDINTPDDEVNEFYDFWNAFASWREFPEMNKNTLESASCREQKREYERENAKAQAGRKKEELARVRKLTESAYKKDPRVVRMKAKANEAKDAAKRKREEEAKAKEEAAKQKAIDDAARAEREKVAAAKAAEDKKNFKEVQKKTRQVFGKSCKAAGLDDEQIDILRANLEVEQMQEINENFAKDAKSPLAIELFNAYYTRYQEEEAKKKSMSAEQKAAAKKLEESAAAAESKPWSVDEDAILVRAITKFPPGSMLRWEQITDMVNTATVRNMKDVIRRAKLMESGLLGTQHIDDKNAFALYTAKMSEKKEKAEAGKTQHMGEEGSATSTVAASAASSSTTPTWTAADQTAFEHALKTVPKDAADRWDQIAAHVKTKTKAQCQQRFKEIAAEVKKQQGKK